MSCRARVFRNPWRASLLLGLRDGQAVLMGCVSEAGSYDLVSPSRTTHKLSLPRIRRDFLFFLKLRTFNSVVRDNQPVRISIILPSVQILFILNLTCVNKPFVAGSGLKPMWISNVLSMGGELGGSPEKSAERQSLIYKESRGGPRDTSPR